MENIAKFLFCLFAMLLSFFSLVFAQTSGDAYRVETFSTPPSVEVQVLTSGGAIEVVGHDRSETTVEMFVRKGGNYLSANDTDLDDYEIEIKSEGGTVTASAKRKDSSSGWLRSIRNSNISISFRVHTPKEAVVEGRTSGGSVSARNLENAVSLRTSGGSVRAENLIGLIDLRTSGGSISIKESEGSLDARTSGGSITVENSSGEIDLRTSGGSINLNNLRGTVSARTSGGGIRTNMLEMVGNLDLRTSGGSIHIGVPAGQGYDLDLRGGRVNVALENFTGTSERNRISGSMNGGGPQINARTSGGSVNVKFI